MGKEVLTASPVGRMIVAVAQSIVITPKTSPTICLLPFMHTYGTADGSLVPCCEAQDFKMADQPHSLHAGLNDEIYKELRRELIKGAKPPACAKCWRNEENGFLSTRQETFTDAEGDHFGDVTNLECLDDGTLISPLSFLEIKTSNVCNLKCRMCHPESSHRLTEDRDLISKYRPAVAWPDRPLRSTKLVNSILRELPLLKANLRMVRYSGGEPLLDADQYRLTRALADSFGHQVELRYATNLTHLKFENEDVLKLWSKFRKVHVKVSIDGIDDVYDYVRVGSKFTQVAENFRRLVDSGLPNLNVSIGCTVSAFNCFQLPEILEYFRAYLPEHAIRFFLLHDPMFMSPAVYPVEVRQRVIERLGDRGKFTEFKDFLQNLGETEDRARWDRLRRYSKEMDERYGMKRNFVELMSDHIGLIDLQIP